MTLFYDEGGISGSARRRRRVPVCLLQYSYARFPISKSAQGRRYGQFAVPRFSNPKVDRTRMMTSADPLLSLASPLTTAAAGAQPFKPSTPNPMGRYRLLGVPVDCGGEQGADANYKPCLVLCSCRQVNIWLITDRHPATESSRCT